MNKISQLPSEAVTAALRTLYDRYGYTRYKMNKFEEYDFYARNKDFLISDSVLTFTDTTGKLMALKPDVTLSIVKSTADTPDTVQKLYYNENVYRVTKGNRSFREIMQVGLEAVGNVDGYCIFEVLLLAAKSLSRTGRNCVLEVSHMGIVQDLLCDMQIPAERQNAILRCIGEKNLHELQSICACLGVSGEQLSRLRSLLSLGGAPRQVLPKVREILGEENASLTQFSAVMSDLEAVTDLPLRIDFSLVSDPRYYNGFVFKGFAEGIPAGILSGGQYDKMMRKMNRKSGAIGFAVYLDLLEQYAVHADPADVDILLVYDESSSYAAIRQQAELLGRDGSSVMVQRAIPEDLRYRTLMVMKNGEVEESEHA